MTKDTSITDTPLSTRAKRALAKEGIHTMSDLQRLLHKFGERYIRERMFGIGKVTAEEILRFLDER